MGVICQSGAVVWKCGANVSPFFQTISGSNIDNFIPQAECFVNVATRKDWSGAWSTLTGDTRSMVTDAVASVAAIDCINYDMSGFITIGEAESMMTILWQKALHAISILKKEKVKEFMGVSDL